MSSGVAVDDECTKLFNEVKMKHTHGYATFKIEDKKRIVLDVAGDKEASYDDFVAALPENEARYALLDAKFDTEDGRPQEKLAFVVWIPEDKISVKDKMLYASSKDALKKKFVGVPKEIQANEPSDLVWETVLETLRKK